MQGLPESTVNLLLSSLMGLIGGMVTIPINAGISFWLKRDEIYLQHRLDMIARQRELLLQHQLAMERQGKQDEIGKLRERLEKLERGPSGRVEA